MQLSIIIVSYNVKYFLEQCLSSVHKAVEGIEAEVWVVDNASSDGTIEYVRSKFPQVQYIVNTSNVGFGKANNMALAKCIGEYVLYLNPDTIVAEDCLRKCLAFMEGNAQAGGLGIRMLDGSGKFLPESKRSFPSPTTSFYKLTGLTAAFPKSRVFARYSLGYLDEDQNHEVDVLSGAFLLSRRAILNSLQGFDEAFFMYGEDIDLSYRIQKAGYKNYYFSESCIIHFKGESTAKGSINYVKMFYEAMRVFVKKHYGRGKARMYSLLIHGGIWVRARVSAGANLFPRKKPNVEVKDALFVGSKDECDEVRLIVSAAGWKGRWSEVVINEDETANVINKIPTVEKSTYLILCEGILSWSRIIELLTRLPSGYTVLFHAKGTQSIVGSSDKNRSGLFIASNH